MASTAEGRVKAKIKKLLNRYGVWHHWPVLNGMGSPILDCIACVRGFYFAIEAKAEGEVPTPRQLETMAVMKRAGAFVFVVSNDAGLAVLEAYLQLITS